MPCTTCLLPTASSSISPIPTLPHKTVKLNVHAPNNSVRTMLIHVSMPPSTGLRPLQPPHTCLTGAPPLPFATKSRTLVCTNLLPPMNIYVSLDAFVTPIYRPHPRISLRRVPPPVCFWGTPLLTRDIVVWISPRAGSSSLVMLYLMSSLFRLRVTLALSRAPLIFFSVATWRLHLVLLIMQLVADCLVGVVSYPYQAPTFPSLVGVV